LGGSGGNQAKLTTLSLKTLDLVILSCLSFITTERVQYMWIKKVVSGILFLVCASITPLAATQPLLHSSDIHRIMDRLFSLHIENRDLNPTIVRRCFKLYIEQFDPEKTYLLDREVLSYLQMSDKVAGEVVLRLNNNDFSDFLSLNETIQRAISRAQALRISMYDRLFDNEWQTPSSGIQSSYAQTEKELLDRQKNRIVRFYLFHKTRSDLSSMERKQKLVALFDKKLRRQESNYLFLQVDGTRMDRKQMEHQLALRILKAFAKSLDTHSSFFSPEEAHEMRLSLEKQFEGVGVILFEGVDGVMISDVVKGSPAEQNGQIQVNDLLVEINGDTLGPLAFEDVLDLLKKDNQREVVLGFQRLDGQGQSKFFRVSLHKRPIVMNDARLTTSWEKFGDGIIGKISLYSFYESNDGMSSEKDVKEAIKSFQKIGHLYGLVLDLRENSGGFLSQAVKVSGIFLSNGVIVISKYGRGEIHYLRNIVGRSFFNGPLVVLTSKMSASASEIVAQALQDYGVALVVGDERTFGKGSIQYQTVTDENADLFFKVTVGKYYTASGRTTQIEGVKADIVVPTYYAPYNIGERFLEYPLTTDRLDPVFVDPLNDLDGKTKRLFQNKYMPYLQRVVSFWKKNLPVLRKNSELRLANNPDFQKMLRHHEEIRGRVEFLPPNSVDETPSTSSDLQMIEAVNIVIDMIDLEQQARPVSPAHELQMTGSDY
jgi:carboxyl-terminal processing protease